MFKHILMPVDGTEFSEQAAGTGIRFAHSLGARLTGFIAEPAYPGARSIEMVSPQGTGAEEHAKRSRSQAESVLRRLAQRARAAGVTFEGSFVESDDPVAAIVSTAEENGCDLIVMASHGRRGLDKLLHGSVTESVMTRSGIPVLVLH